jgi:serine/threonine protein kinase/tetratricopeptide (TPR) repeat protein
LWQRGASPDLKAFLVELGVREPEELLDLLRVDQRHSWHSGDRRPTERYVELCPELRSHSEHLLELVSHEIELQEERGEAPRLDDYQGRFPELADQLERHFEARKSDDPYRTVDPMKNGPLPLLDSECTLGPPPGVRKDGLVSSDSIDLAAIPQSLKQQTADPHDPYSTLARSPAHATEPFVGPEVAGYEIVRELGRGGMGVVFLARQKGLNRRVALKMMLAGSMAERSDFERFRSEAETLARLQHPNIIQIYDIGEHADQPYFSLEFAPGGSLDSKLHGTPQPAAVCAELMEILARAIFAAHQAGIIHRDLKPANILLSPIGTEEVKDDPASIAGRDHRDWVLDLKRWLPKITDFGLAKRLDAESGQTHSGDILGTPCYMAPEQAQGQTSVVGPLSDIYTLGAILYELLTGRPPFKGETAWDTLTQVVQQEPVPPRRLRPKVPRDLETICLKCLDKAPLRRYRTAAELADDIQRFREGRPIHARPMTIVGRTIKLVKRRPWVSALVASLVLAVAGGAALALENLVKGRQLAEQELARIRRTEDDRDKVRGMLQDAEKAAAARRWSDAEALLKPVRDLINGNPDLGEYHDRAELLNTQVIGFSSAADTLKRFTAHCEEARFHQSQLTGLDFTTNVEKTRAAARSALAVAGIDVERPTPPALGPYFSDAEQREIADGCYEQLLTLASTIAEPLAVRGEEPRKQALQALALLDLARNLGRPASRTLHLQRAQCLARCGDAAGAEEARHAAAALEPSDALEFFLLGLESYRAKDYHEALKQFGKALEKPGTRFWARYLSGLCHVKLPTPQRTHYLAAVRDLTVCGEQRPTFAWIFLVRGYVHTEVGDFDSADRDFERARATVNTPAARYTLFVNRGVMRLKQRQYPVAVAEFERAIAVQPGQYQAHLDLARVYQEMDQLDKALAEYETALRCATTAEAEAGPKLQASIYRSRAVLNQQHKKNAAALADFRDAARLDAQASDHIECGRLLLQAHKDLEALTALDAALRLQPDDTTTLHLRAVALKELHRPAEALASLDRALQKTKPTAELCELRGRVRADLGEHAAAIDDYSEALALKPATATYAFRGWAYLIADAPRLALRDFEEVVKREPTHADGYNGRASARVKLGQHRLALKDAEEAVRLDPSSRSLYKASRVYAQAIGKVEADANEPNRKSQAREYQDRAVQLLRRSIEAVPAEQRGAFWHEYVQNDTALVAIYRSTEFLRLKSEYGKGVR